MREVCFFCSPTYCLQPNCALDKWRDIERTKEAAIKINHLDTHRRQPVPVLFVCTIVQVQCVFECALPDSNPIPLNLHPLRNLSFSFYRLAVIHFHSSNYYCSPSLPVFIPKLFHPSISFSLLPASLPFLCSLDDCTLTAADFWQFSFYL